MTYDKEKTCCFTGHRIIPQKDRGFLKEETEKICLGLIEKGYENFIAGGALGFDTLAEKCVLKLKEKYPNIKLILAIPCKDQHKSWTKKDKETYEEILNLADDKIYVSESYTPECMKSLYGGQQQCSCCLYNKSSRRLCLYSNIRRGKGQGNNLCKALKKLSNCLTKQYLCDTIGILLCI